MTRSTKIFGVRVPLDSKVLVGILFGVALLLAWYNLSGSSDDHPVNNVGRSAAAANTVSSTATPAPGRSVARRADLVNRAKQGTLHFSPIDPTREDVDPTLRLWLLERVRAVTPIEGGRNLFETGPDIAQGNVPPFPPVQKIIPAPLPSGPAPGAASAAGSPNIPLRYYGFVKPSFRGDGNRGYFMDGENNILMATEGDLLKSQFLVVTLSPNVARVEDIQLKRGQDLQLIPEAIAQ